MKGAPKPVATIVLTLINTAVLQCQAWDGSCREGDIKMARKSLQLKIFSIYKDKD